MLLSELSLPEPHDEPVSFSEEERASLPAIVRFWSSAYRRYRRPLNEGLGFHVPQFPTPLHSPNFVTGPRERFLRLNRGLVSHFNEIVPLGHDQRGPSPAGFRLDKQFYLGELTLGKLALPPGFTVREVPLARAAAGEELPALLADGFGREAPGLRATALFLGGLDADFRVAFLEERGRTVGAVSVGVAAGEAVLLNAVVLSPERGRGLSPVLAGAAGNLALRMGARAAFFWAEHANLGRYAARLRHYRSFVQTNA